MVDLIKACTATLHSQHYLVMMLKDHFVFKKTDSGEYEKKEKEERNLSHIALGGNVFCYSKIKN